MSRSPKKFLSSLRALNVERCNKHFFKLRAWTVLEWAGAAAGEAGETANVAKKMRRISMGKKRILTPRSEIRKLARLHSQLADEVADTVIYMDLLCASQGINLEEAIARKFNKVSRQKGFKRVLR